MHNKHRPPYQWTATGESVFLNRGTIGICICGRDPGGCDPRAGSSPRPPPSPSQRGRSPTAPPPAAQGASRAGRQGAASTSCYTVRRCTRSCSLTSTRRSGRVPPSSGTLSSKRSRNCVRGPGWVAPERRRVVLHVPTLRPWPFSVSVARCSASTRPGPWRSTAARASRQRAVVALFAAVRLPQRVRHSSCRPLEVVSSQQVTQTKEWALLTGNGLVLSPRPHLLYMWTCCWYTRGRFESTHGGVLGTTSDCFFSVPHHTHRTPHTPQKWPT